MEIVIGLFIFCLILFLYLHVTFQLRTSNDLEVYEIDNVSKNRLEEICDIRQPVILAYMNEPMTKSLTKDNLLRNMMRGKAVDQMSSFFDQTKGI